jgi:hypothetical protein
MRKTIGRRGRVRFLFPAAGALGLVAMAACSSGRAPTGEATIDPLASASTALSLSIAPATLGFELDLDGEHLELALERSQPPTAADYRDFQRTRDGRMVALPPLDLSCTYRGLTEVIGGAVDAAPGFAAMSVCSSATGHAAGQAASGVIRTPSGLWRLSPDPLDQDDSDGIDHLAQPLRRPDASGRVPELTRRVTLRRLPESIAPRLAFREGSDEETKYIDLVVVNDAERVAELGGDTRATTLQFVDTMNALLDGSGLSPRLRVTLRSQVLFEEDPYTPVFEGDEVNNDSLLDEFLVWGATEDLPDHDERMLLSGYDFVGGVVGYAGLGVACTTNANGFIIQAGDASGGFAVLSAVHELGHTLGMNHDSGTPGCPQQGFIMAAVGCGNCAGAEQADFSPCSIQQFQNYLASATYTSTRCGDDVPVGTQPSCGDGAVQEGETCDCGSSDCSDIDPCCNGALCQLQGDAECSDFNDGCCRNCEIVGGDEPVVCRAARSSCDIAESCTGASKECPADTFQAAGDECEDERGNSGACYFGDCRSRGTQCEDLAEQQSNNPDFDDVGPPGPGCPARCDVVVCGNGPNGCINIGGPNVLDGVPCTNGGQCVDNECVEAIDQCPNDPAKQDPGVCGCGAPDSDRDADGTPDCDDGCDDDANKQSPGACGCGAPDSDGDGDGTPDCIDECPSDATKSDPGDCGCGQAETDSDGDGAADCIDECPDDSQQSEAGACGCGVREVDADLDGAPDCDDGCITDPTRTAPPCTLANGIDDDGDGDVDRLTVSGSAKAKGGCAIAAPGAQGATPARTLGALGGLALALLLPIWRRRRR